MEGAHAETVCESTPEAHPQASPPAPPAAARSLTGVGTGGLSTHPDRQVLPRVPSHNSALGSSATQGQTLQLQACLERQAHVSLPHVS